MRFLYSRRQYQYYLLLVIGCYLTTWLDARRLGDEHTEENVVLSSKPRQQQQQQQQQEQRRRFLFREYQHSKLFLDVPTTQKEDQNDGGIMHNQYWIRFRGNVVDVTSKVTTLLERAGCGKVLWSYKITTRAFAINVEDCRYPEQIDELLDDDDVIDAVPVPIVTANEVKIQDASNFWWLDRMDDKLGRVDSEYKYSYDGTGVQIYILDTGIRWTHSEFSIDSNSNGGSRASCGFNTLEEDGEPCNDNRGHGTHCAGLAAGKTYGVAKNATVIAVRVLTSDGKGSMADVMRGLEYVAEQKRNNTNQPMVVSMSFNTPQVDSTCFLDFPWFDGCLQRRRERFQGYDDALSALSDMGVVIVNSAGNDFFRSACRYFPGSNEKSITVGATNQWNMRAFYTNIGPCVDVFAPGTFIKSAYALGDYATFVGSGTSASAPLVAGVAALYLQRDPTMTSDEVKQQIIRDASRLGRPPLTPRQLINTAELLVEDDDDSNL